jgi:1-deoxy-D-xylulose-5-phosphate reductoisomerase
MVTGPRRITILGSTGSIGDSTIDLIERDAAAYDVVALTANSNWAKLAEQARRLKPAIVAVADPGAYADLKVALAGTGVKVVAGAEGVCEAADAASDWVMAAIVGAAGLKPTLTAVARGTVIALANKECLVSAGSVFTDAVTRHKATLLPVDSEHNAIFQVFDFDQKEKVRKVILTASGGPFRTWSTAEMREATPKQAVAHPKWSMGAKISVDSATMMNKGLEMIEAAYLFGVDADRIDVLVHPESIIHSLVEYADGSSLAQLGAPDMRTPIAVAFAWPDRVAWPAPRLDLGQLGRLTFEPPDAARFPALDLAQQALKAGGPAPGLLNAANEVAVEAFLDRRIGYLDIAAIVSETLDRAGAEHLGDDMADRMPDDILEQARRIDRTGRRLADAAIEVRRARGAA